MANRAMLKRSPIFAPGYSPPPSQLHIPLSTFSLHPPTTTDSTLFADDKAIDPSRADLVPLSSFVFGLEPRPDIIHRCIKFERSLFRAGNANTKGRSEVNYSGRKLRQQKGTGRARLGDRSSPLLRGGAVSHGAKPKDWSTGLPRKEWELGIRHVLSERWTEGNLFVVPRFDMSTSPPAPAPAAAAAAVGEGGWKDLGSEALESYLRHKRLDSAVFIAGDGWDLDPTSPSSPTSTLALRTALERRALIRPSGVRLGQSGTWWESLQRSTILPLLDSVSLAHPDDFAPGRPHPLSGWRPGRIGIYHLLLHKKVVFDLKGLELMQERLTRDRRRSVGALGTDEEEARAWDDMLRSANWTVPSPSLP